MRWKTKKKAIKENVEDEGDKDLEAEEETPDERVEREKKEEEEERMKRKRKVDGKFIFHFGHFTIFMILSKLSSYEQNKKNTKNCKNCYISGMKDEDAEKKQIVKRQKESMRLFSTLYKVDPTVVDKCTEEVTLERIEEKHIRLENEKNDGKKELESMSTHAIGALIPVVS